MHARAKRGGDLVVPSGTAQQSCYRPLSRSAGQPQVGHPAEAFFESSKASAGCSNFVIFDVTVGIGMNADRSLATIARAIWFGTLCGKVPQLVTIVKCQPDWLEGRRPAGAVGCEPVGTVVPSSSACPVSRKRL